MAKAHEHYKGKERMANMHTVGIMNNVVHYMHTVSYCYIAV